jgi:pyruvate dehydrogenase E2 component (dihydrolipoamide acetyltransferase)
VDTAKSAIDVETFHSGTIGQLIVSPGETVPVGTVLATLTSAAAEPAPAEAPAKKAGPPAARPGAPRPAKPAAARPAGKTAAAGSPLVRHLAQELGVDLATVQGTGRAGAITRSDVEKAAASRREGDAAGPPHRRRSRRRPRRGDRDRAGRRGAGGRCAPGRP